MTTGNVVVGAITRPGIYYSKVWNGANGRYIPGTHRIKYNDYSMVLWKLQIFGATTNGVGIGNDWRFNSAGLWGSNDDLSLLSDLAQAVRGHGFNMAVALGEGRQTLNLATTTAMTLYKTLKQLRSGNVSGATRTLFANSGNKPPTKLTSKTLAGRWLELQYGWKPLINDVYEAAKAWEQLTSAPRRTVIKVSKIKNVQKQIIPKNDPNFVEELTHFRMRKQIIYEMTEDLSVARSLGLTDPASLVWELLPYSFVADWFIPIGTYLEVLNTIPKLSGRFCTTSKLEYPLERFGKTPGGYAGQGVRGRKIHFFRSSSALTVPRPSFKTMERALSVGHLENALALLRSALPR